MFYYYFCSKSIQNMSRVSEIQLPINSELDIFVEMFDSSLSSNNEMLSHAVEHVKSKKGKMMRPILILLIARLFGEINDSTYHAAVALEMLHTASLVHDDVVDESEERRGQLSVNAIFNNKASVLVGDFMFATSLVHAGMVENNDIIKVIATLGQNLSDGEILQLSNVSNPNFSEQVYFDIIKKKTAALFAACTKIAALSVNCSEEQVEHIRLFGEYIGICFQIRDDIFDYFDDKTIGKPTGNDMLEGKLTLPALYVLNKCKDEKMIKIAKDVKAGKANLEETGEFIQFIKDNGGIEYAISTMDSFRKKALNLLSELPKSRVKESLEMYVDYVAYRNI